MPTKNERISLVNDTEEVTAVKAPPPGLILESKIVLTEPFPIGGREEADSPTPPPVLVSPRAVTPGMTRATTPAKTLLQPPGPPTSSTPPGLPPIAAPFWPPRPLTNAISSPRPSAGSERAAIVASMIASPQRPVVDLVPISQRLVPLTPSSGSFLAPKGETWAPRSPSRVGLYAALIGLLVGGATLIGWRQWWSARPGRIEISTTPPGAVITVGNEAPVGRSPVALEKAPGSYTISVAHEGFLRSERTIVLHAGQEVVLGIALAPAEAAAGKAASAVAEPPGVRAGAPAPRHFPTGGSPAARPTPTRALARGEPAAGPRPFSAAAARAIAQPIAPLDDNQVAPRAEEPPPRAAAATAPAEAPPAAPGPTAAPARDDSPAAPANAPAPAEARAAHGTDGAPAARTIAGRVAKAQLAIDPNADEYRVKLPPSLARADMKLSAVVKMCVSADGKVSDVKLLKSADPAIDSQIPGVLGKWRYRPLLIGGQAVPFCYVQQYEIASD